MNEKILKALAEAKTDAERSKVLKDAGFYSEDEFREGLVKAGASAGPSPELLKQFEKQAADFEALKKAVVEFQRPAVFGDPNAHGIRDNGAAGGGNGGAILRSFRQGGETRIAFDRLDKDHEDFVKQVRASVEQKSGFRRDAKVGVTKALSGESNTAGGFAIGPGDFMSAILEIVFEDSKLWNMGQKVSIGTDSWSRPQLVQTFGDSPAYDGLSDSWGRAQNSAITENTNPTYQLRELRAKEVTVTQLMPVELLADAPQFLSHMTSLMGRFAARRVDLKGWTGNGLTEPLGILTDPSAIAGATSRITTNRVKIADITNLDDAMDEAFQGGVYWGRKKVFGNIAKDVSATEGLPKAQLMLLDLSLPLNPGRRPINGYPVNITKNTPALGTTGDLTLLDPISYLWGVRQDWTLETSDQAYWTSRQFAMRLVARLDGMLIWPDGAKLLSSTQA